MMCQTERKKMGEKDKDDEIWCPAVQDSRERMETGVADISCSLRI